MNGKLVIEVTIAEVLHPLLYERLRECSSARERAAVFKACAEAYLRGPSALETSDDDGFEPALAGTGTAAGAVPHSQRPATALAVDVGETHEFRSLSTGESGGMSGDFGDALGGIIDRY